MPSGIHPVLPSEVHQIVVSSEIHIFSEKGYNTCECINNCALENHAPIFPNVWSFHKLVAYLISILLCLVASFTAGLCSVALIPYCKFVLSSLDGSVTGSQVQCELVTCVPATEVEMEAK
jgi:hypothetical protein